MHASEMEAESRKLRLFTDSRFKLKSSEYDKSLKAITETTKTSVDEIRAAAKNCNDTIEEAMRYRLEDFTT